ncbi:MAG: MerR family transcriptional regulator [Verrucomicrobiae bacterium]|nr:MerR family transcriptional regulator [Verrucomicrobiae bacterium]
MSHLSQNTSEAYYEVGAVAKISGLSPHTIRTWERRDFIKAANRSTTGRRQYSKDQVNRLILFRQLTQLGDSISALANLSMDDLNARLADFHRVKQTRVTNRTLIIKVYTDQAFDRLSGLSDDFSLIHPAREEDTRNPDLIVLEIDGTEHQFQIALNRACAEFPGVPIVLMYDFLQRDRLRNYGKQGYFLIKKPIPQELLEQYLSTAAGHRQKPGISKTAEEATEAEIKPRMLNDRQLQVIASSTPRIKCECPQHMASLVSSLTGFEDYSARCETESPEDTILHAHLGREVAKARHIVEKALVYLCETDQIDIPDDTV